MTREEQKEARKIQIIEATLDLFVERGYYGTKTSQISKRAGLSEGLLFHYFGNKVGVYQFIYDYSVRYMTLELRSSVDSKESDLFTVLKQMERARMHAMKGYPYMQQFLNRSMSEDCYEALLAVEEKKNVLEEACAAIDAQIDYTALPAGIDGEKLRKMLDFTIKGLMTERFQNASFQPEMLYEEVCDYLDVMRKIVYR